MEAAIVANIARVSIRRGEAEQKENYRYMRKPKIMDIRFYMYYKAKASRSTDVSYSERKKGNEGENNVDMREVGATA